MKTCVHIMPHMLVSYSLGSIHTQAHDLEKVMSPGVSKASTPQFNYTYVCSLHMETTAQEFFHTYL